MCSTETIIFDTYEIIFSSANIVFGLVAFGIFSSGAIAWKIWKCFKNKKQRENTQRQMHNSTNVNQLQNKSVNQFKTNGTNVRIK